MKPIVVVGSINMDLVSRVERIPRPGETVSGVSFQMHSGGKGANQAVAVGRLEYPCVMLGRVGRDVFGDTLLKSIQSAGVDVSSVERSNASTGTASILVDTAGENCIVVTPGANNDVTVDYLETKLDTLRSAGIVLSQLEIPLATVDWLAKTCAQFQVPFMLDPAPARDLPASLLKNVDWFTPNETEAAFFAKRTEFAPERIIDSLRARGVRGIILKRGVHGAILQSEVEHAEISAYEVKAVDTTAAGDAFNGAFAVARMRGADLLGSLKFGAAAAAISVTRNGAQPSMASTHEVEKFMSSAGRESFL